MTKVSSTLQIKLDEDRPLPILVIETPRVRWLTDKKRVEVVELQYPFELDGVEYRKIWIQRLTAGEVAAFATKMHTDTSKAHRFPLFRDAAGVEIPDAVWDALDDDDRFALTEAATDFFPVRFREPTAAPAS